MIWTRPAEVESRNSKEKKAIFNVASMPVTVLLNNSENLVSRKTLYLLFYYRWKRKRFCCFFVQEKETQGKKNYEIKELKEVENYFYEKCGDFKKIYKSGSKICLNETLENSQL